MNIHNVLLATDFSSYGEAALQFARFLAKHYRAKLIVAHVISESVYTDVPPELMQEAKVRTTADARAKLERVGQFEKDLQMETMLQEGPVADTLLTLADSQRVDLLVVGTRGHGRIKRLLLGSVAEKLSRQSRCPVFVVPDAAMSYDMEFNLRTILCPTNFSERSRAALNQAWDLAKSFSANILLMHVLQDSTVDRATRIAQRDATKEQMKSLRTSLFSNETSPEIEFLVEFGPIAPTIARVAAERGTSLVVLSVARGKPVLAHLPAEMTYSVVRQVSCPVLTIAS